MSDPNFTEAQKQYLAGFAYGRDVARAVRRLPVLSGSGANGQSVTVGGSTGDHGPTPPEAAAFDAQSAVLSSGKKLVAEEKAKREKNPLDMWDEIDGRSQRSEFPKGTDVFLTKFHGLFYVAPAQNAYMCRLRIPGGELYACQLTGLADLADASAGGYLDVTTRANLQLREISADQAMPILYGLRELGIINVGAGGDNIRNVTASPLSGIDPHELIETLPLAKRMHHYILNHREMYGLPRKFNIAFDGSGTISALEDTNDIGFRAVRVAPDQASGTLPAGVYFLLTLGGITGHQDFARSTGVLCTAEESITVAAAIVRVFIEHGDRTDRKRARLKYLLDAWGFERFLTEVDKRLERKLRFVEAERFTRPSHENRQAHIGVHPQKQAGKNYIGLVLPVGRMTTAQARGLASISSRYGCGKLALTVWQNLIIPDISDSDVELVCQEIRGLGLDFEATSVRAGLVACTGSAGCKYAGADTKQHALQIARYVEQRLRLDVPVNIHVTGCHHSCAQHYIGDIGLIAARVAVGEDMVDGYHVHVGGGWGDRQGIARLVCENVLAEDTGPVVCALLAGFLQYRDSPQQSFVEFAAQQSITALQNLVDSAASKF